MDKLFFVICGLPSLVFLFAFIAFVILLKNVSNHLVRVGLLPPNAKAIGIANEHGLSKQERGVFYEFVRGLDDYVSKEVIDHSREPTQSSRKVALHYEHAWPEFIEHFKELAETITQKSIRLSVLEYGWFLLPDEHA